MKKLQIVIVNYNVRYFLEQCLHSVFKAIEGISAQVWVVDNASRDDSLQMIQEKFPQVRVIANRENVGFSKANNQALLADESEYCLLLNPDTLIHPDAVRKCLVMMDNDPRYGALGIRMVDGSGRYLPESKRGLPTPWVAFCKTMGLHKIWKNSPKLDGYYLGFLDPMQNHEVQVLSGAFMLLRRSALQETGLLDEDYFMYGEDVDLSYTMELKGYKNAYLGESSIIHYKGESTKKGSLDYLVTFYRAMILFSRKHFQGTKARIYDWILRIAIVFHGLLSFLKYRFLKYAGPMVDIALIGLGIFGITQWWELYRFDNPFYYKESMYFINIPVYTLIWILALWLSGAYDRIKNYSALLRGVTIGFVLILIVYALWSEELRNSRMILLMSYFYVLFYVFGFRRILDGRDSLQGLWRSDRRRHTLIVGGSSESYRVKEAVEQMDIGMGRSLVLDSIQVNEIEEYVHLYRVKELIFCLADVDVSLVLEVMERLGERFSYRCVAPESDAIVGSPSRNSRGSLYLVGRDFVLSSPVQRRQKWIFDRLSSLIMLVLCWVFLFRSRDKGKYFHRVLAVLVGQKTWVSYLTREGRNLPSLGEGIFTPISGLPEASPSLYDKYDYHYARDYHWSVDADIVWKNI